MQHLVVVVVIVIHSCMSAIRDDDDDAERRICTELWSPIGHRDTNGKTLYVSPARELDCRTQASGKLDALNRRRPAGYLQDAT